MVMVDELQVFIVERTEPCVLHGEHPCRSVAFVMMRVPPARRSHEDAARLPVHTQRRNNVAFRVELPPEEGARVRDAVSETLRELSLTESSSRDTAHEPPASGGEAAAAPTAAELEAIDLAAMPAWSLADCDVPSLRLREK